VIATSQMQATDCRRAFPCWDEPDFKAVFGVTLVVADDLLAVSNGPEIAREPAGDGLVRVRFADTMPMSTYLIAFVVGPLVATEPVDVDGVPLRVVHVPGKEHLTGFGLEIGAFALRWFQDYYGIPYPGEKVDLVALPDFAAGAMENLGCITFRENLLLVEPATSTQQEEQVVADVVAHEVAHMWFGDLVTMRWWNGIWLNEAFATFMEVACCNAFRPSWNRWTSFSLERSAAFEVDGLVSTRPVEYEVVSPEDADGMFDVLTYEKGGALLRMLEQYLGADRFRDGIRHYLRAHSYANTETGDLWDAIELVTGEPVRRIMDTWIWQGGYPLVTAMVHGDELVLSQQRFLFDGDDDGTRWAIPLQVRLLTGAGEQTERVLLDGDEVRLRLDDPSAVVVVNAGAHAFLRVHYTDELLGRLTGHALARLSTPERYALVDDAWSSVVAGRTGADAFVHFARGFADEPELQVWQVLLNGLRWCDRFLAGTNREHFQAYVRALVGPALARLGWEVPEGADPLAGELRATLIRALAVLGADPSAQARAREVHSSPGDYDPAVAAAALQVVAATGGEAEYEAFVEGFRTAPTPQESLRYLYALGDFPDAELVRRTCELCLSGEVKTQNAPFLLARCILHRDHGELAWRFVREHWDEANTRFPSNTIVRMVDPVKTLTTPAQQADVAGFFAEHGIPQAAKTLEQVLERQRVNVALRARATGPLEDEFS
jgi:puromycin-sensitive aminopeptidase